MTPLRSLVAVIALLVLPLDALAATDLDQFLGKVRKSAPTVADATPPVVCICKNGTVLNGAGQLFAISDVASGGFVVVLVCAVPVFDFETGDKIDFENCSNWELLPK